MEFDPETAPLVALGVAVLFLVTVIGWAMLSRPKSGWIRGMRQAGELRAEMIMTERMAAHEADYITKGISSQRETEKVYVMAPTEIPPVSKPRAKRKTKTTTETTVTPE